jgi:hypothetical protein
LDSHADTNHQPSRERFNKEAIPMATKKKPKKAAKKKKK